MAPASAAQLRREERQETAELGAANKRPDAEPATPVRRQVIAQTIVHCFHPDTGLEVDFIPGEALPAWAIADAETQAVQATRETHATGTVTRPARNASTKDWQAYAGSLPSPLPVATDAGREEIIGAYIASVAPAGNASTETWTRYAIDHGIDVDDKNRADIRAAVIAAGWATEG